MVGVPGHSKACCTCRRRKKGVSWEALGTIDLLEAMFRFQE
jgi:hypothetical protein